MARAERDRAYYLANRERILERRRIHRLVNRERITAQQREHYAGTRSESRVRHEAYRAANPEKVRANHAAYQAANVEKAREWRRAWKRRNPAKARSASALAESRRRARIAGAKGSFSLADWEGALAFFDHACAYCGAANPQHREHVVPLCRAEHSPTHGPENILPACKPCNSSKRSRLVSEWRPEIVASLVDRVAPWNPALAERIGQ